MSRFFFLPLGFEGFILGLDAGGLLGGCSCGRSLILRLCLLFLWFGDSFFFCSGLLLRALAFLGCAFDSFSHYYSFSKFGNTIVIPVKLTSAKNRPKRLNSTG